MGGLECCCLTGTRPRQLPGSPHPGVPQGAQPFLVGQDFLLHLVHLPPQARGSRTLPWAWLTMEPSAVSFRPVFASPCPKKGTGWGFLCFCRKLPLYSCGCVFRCCPWKPRVTSSSPSQREGSMVGGGNEVVWLLLLDAFPRSPRSCLMREALSLSPFYREGN